MGRHPLHLNGVRFVLATVLMCVVAGGALELFWRSKGHFPVAGDTASLWGVHVDKVSRLDDRAVVVVGSSRVQLGLDPAIIQKELNASKVVQLARAASSAMPVLEYLADETDFSGLVICGVTPGIFFDALDRQRQPIAEAFDQRDNRPFYTPFEEVLLGKAQSAICLNNSSLSWKLAGNGIVRGNWPSPPYARFNENRFIQADYTTCHELDILLNDFLRLMKGGAPMSEAGLSGMVAHLSGLAETFKARGGRLVLVRMPSSGVLWETEAASYPKEKYWQALKARFGSDAIHFHDLEKDTGYQYNCPDGSHLDYRDAERITVDLCERIK